MVLARSALALALVMATALPARADELPTIDSAIPPAIRIGRRDARAIPLVQLELHGAPDVSWLVIEPRERFGSVELDLSLPAGTRIVGMARITGDRRVWGAPQPAREAFVAFTDGPGTALARRAGASGGLDHYMLHLETADSRLELALELPASPRLALDPAVGTSFDRAEITIDGQPARSSTIVRDSVVLDTHALAAIHHTDPYPHVDATTSLVVGNPTRDPGRFVHTRFPSVPPDSNGKRGIRAIVHRHEGQLRRCYMQVAQWQPSIAGTITLSFFIEDDGTVTWSDVTGDLPASVTDCIRDLALTWAFEPQQRVLVHYPLTFRLAE